MAKQNSNTDNRRKRQGALIVAFIIILLIVNGVKFYVDYQKDIQTSQMLKDREEQIEDAQARLDRLQNELELKIEEIQKLDGDVTELNEALAQVRLEKEALNRRDAAKSARLSELDDKVEGFQELLRLKDQEIQELKAVNDQLMSENTELKNTTNQLQDTLSALSQNRDQLLEKVDMASRLKAENIRITAVNKRGKEMDGELRSRNIEELVVNFNIAENSVAPKQAHDIFIRVIDPNGDVMYDVATTSGTFLVNGRELFYTAKQTILFDNTRKRRTFRWTKSSEWTEGEHQVELYCDSYLVGTGTFMVKTGLF